ncbi:MAG: hypothetical protein ABSH20_17680, partial [Tepidisphaeraceae bacterium]
MQLLKESIQGHRDALNEVVGERPLFQWEGSGPLNFCAFLLALGNSPLPRALGIRQPNELEIVYDQTVLRFLEMPPNSNPSGTVEARGHDLRAILSAVVESVQQRLGSCRAADAIHEEAIAAQQLQRAVVRHYVYSCLEVRRSRLLGRSLYRWRVERDKFRLWMPRWLAGRRREPWLAAAVFDADPDRPDEQERIQR